MPWLNDEDPSYQRNLFLKAFLLLLLTLIHYELFKQFVMTSNCYNEIMRLTSAFCTHYYENLVVLISDLFADFWPPSNSCDENRKKEIFLQFD